MSEGGTVAILLSGAVGETWVGVGVGTGWTDWTGGVDEHPAEHTKKMRIRTRIAYHFFISYTIVEGI
jgi:hypothetical protein